MTARLVSTAAIQEAELEPVPTLRQLQRDGNAFARLARLAGLVYRAGNHKPYSAKRFCQVLDAYARCYAEVRR